MVMRRVNWERGIIKVGDIKLEKTGLTVFRHSRLFTTLSLDQFQLFYLLMQESPGFVSEDAISKHLYDSDFVPQNADSIRGLIQRLRKKLGMQLGRRIKNKSRLGWTYVQPRQRDKTPASCP
jgi:DNA-binding response OmpR family regulator